MGDATGAQHRHSLLGVRRSDDTWIETLFLNLR
jgi:hypothetical protein